MKKFIGLAMAAALIALSMAGCATPAPTVAPTAEVLEFKVGMECGYAPFNWTQPDDSNGAVPIQGTNEYAGSYDVEIAKIIAQGLGRKLVIVKTVWDGLTPAVQSGTIDAIIAGMSPRADRKESIDFTDNYYRSNLVIIVRKGSKYENAVSLEDFSGAKITGQLNTVHYDVIDQIPGVVKQTAMDDFPAMRVALQSGTIDGYVAEQPEGISVAAAGLEFTMVQFAADKGFTASDDDVAVAVGLKKGQPELIAKINEILSGISEEQRAQIMAEAIKNQPVMN